MRIFSSYVMHEIMWRRGCCASQVRYQHGVMSGMNDNVERLSGQKPMSVGDFAPLHLDELNPKSTI